jgi:RNase H-fold protein (predicted Holliday junction resolvase)
MGFAVGDDTTGVALASKIGAARVVLGLPTLEDGSRGPASRRTERLVEALEASGIAVALQSEFLSTDEARRRARVAGRPPRQPVDDIAAQVLLEEHLTTRSAPPSAES